MQIRRPVLAGSLALLAMVLPQGADAQSIASAQFVTQFGVSVPSPGGSFDSTLENAVDSTTGEVYVLESYRVQVFDANGVYLRQWQCDSCGGIDVNSATGDVYVTRYSDNRVARYKRMESVPELTWGGTGPGNGTFQTPWGIAVNPVNGDVYVHDTVNGVIQQFTGTGTFIRQFGTLAQFTPVSAPAGLAFDPVAQVLYGTDPFTTSVSKFDADGNFLLRFGVFGTGLGQLRWPRAVEVAPNGDVFVADTDNERIHVFSPLGVAQYTFQGAHGRATGPFHPRCIAINRTTGEKYANAAYAFRVDKFDANDQFLFSFGNRTSDGIHLEDPRGIAVSPVSGDVYVVDSGNFLIKSFTPGGSFKLQVGGSERIDPAGLGLLGFAIESGIDVDPDGNVWTGRTTLHYFLEPPSLFVNRYDERLNATSAWLRLDKNGVQYSERIRAVAIDPATRDVWLADGAFSRVHNYSSAGVLNFSIPGISQPSGIALGGGFVYVLENGQSRIRRYTLAGSFDTQWGSAGTASGEFRFEESSQLSVAPWGDVIVADSLNHRLQQFTPQGGFVASLGSFGFGNGQFNRPIDSAWSPSGNLMYVLDHINDRVQVFCVGALPACNAELDADADGLPDPSDSCPYQSMAQTDAGRVASPGNPTGAGADGIGDGCQCGALTPDGQVTDADLSLLRGYLADPTTPIALERCSVIGNEECDVRNAAALARSLAGRPGGVRQVCSAATRLPPY